MLHRFGLFIQGPIDLKVSFCWNIIINMETFQSVNLSIKQFEMIHILQNLNMLQYQSTVGMVIKN